MDIDKLVDAVTRVIMERLNGGSTGQKVVAFGDVPQGMVCGDFDVVRGTTSADIAGCDYIVMTRDSFNAFHGGVPAAAALAPVASASCDGGCGGKVIDLCNKRLIHERDLRDLNTQGGDIVQVSKNAIVTALAHDYAKGIGAKIQKS